MSNVQPNSFAATVSGAALTYLMGVRVVQRDLQPQQ